MSSDRNPTITAESISIIKRGVAALKRLDSDANWRDWVTVGEAIVECRKVAMAEAGASQPQGPRYREAYARLMKHYHFTEKLKDKSDRAKLVAVMDDLPAIEAWRQQLTADERRRWNHPVVVWRQYQAAQRKAVETPEDDLWKKPSAKDQLRAAKAEIHRMRKEGAPLWGPGDSPEEQARAVMEHMSLAEAEAMFLAGLQLVKAARMAAGRSEREKEEAAA